MSTPQEKLIAEAKQAYKRLFADEVGKADTFPSIKDYSAELEPLVVSLTEYFIMSAYLKGFVAALEGREKP